jgi:hypothetical protein
MTLMDYGRDDRKSNRQSDQTLNVGVLGRRSFLGAGGLAALSAAHLLAQDDEQPGGIEITGRTSLSEGHRHEYEIVLNPDGRIVGETSFEQGHRHAIETTLNELETGFAGVSRHSHTLEPTIRIEEPERTWGDPLEILGGPFDPSATVVIVKDEEGRPLHLPIVQISPTSILSAVPPLRDQIGPATAQLEVTTAVAALSEPLLLRILPTPAKDSSREALIDVIDALEGEREALGDLVDALNTRLGRFSERLDADATRRLNEFFTAVDRVEDEINEALDLVRNVPAENIPANQLAILALAADGARKTSRSLVGFTEALAQAPPPPLKQIEIIIVCLAEVVGIVTIQVVAIKVMVAVCAFLVTIPIIGALLCALTVLVASWVFVAAVVTKLVLIMRHVNKLRDP